MAPLRALPALPALPALVVWLSLIGSGAVAQAEEPALTDVALASRLRASCGSTNEGLDRVAAGLAQRKAQGEAAPDLPELAMALRSERVAHVWPRSWVARTPAGEAPDSAALTRSFATFRASVQVRSRALCGAAVTTLPTGARIAAVVLVDAQGELAPLKERVRIGEWLTVEASLQGDFRGAQVMVRGPHGAPRVVPGHFVQSTGKLRATFAPDAPGAFTVQVVGETDSGPRPVLETLVFAGVTPSYTNAPARAAPRGAPPDETLFMLVEALRSENGLPRLVRDPRLDALAREHVMAMMKKHLLAHDTGAGDPRNRVEAAGLRATIVGENAATGREVSGLHRALTDSPSHNANLRRADFDSVGVAAVVDAEGALWGCELFAGGLH